MPRFPRVPTFWPSESKLPLSYPTPTSKAREKRPGDEVDPTPPFSAFNGELKQQRRRRLQKRHLKSEFAPLQTLSRLFHLVYFVKCWQMFLELNSKGLYQSSGKEKKVVVLCSRPQQNVNSGTFTL